MKQKRANPLTGFARRAVAKAMKRVLLFRKTTVQRCRGFGRRPSDKLVVFVGGIQRSGTNMLMGMLECSLETQIFHESDARAFIDYEMRSSDTIHSLVRHSHAPIIVIKALCELQDLKHLLDDFGPAKVLWMVRNLDDMVNSHMRKWTSCPSIIANIIADRESGGWRGRGMSDATHAVISRLHHPEIDDASAVALFWYFRNILFFEQGFDTDDRVIVVRYETLSSRPLEQAPNICRFLGLEYAPVHAKGIFTTSIGKDAPPDIEPDIRDLCKSLEIRLEKALERQSTGQN